MKMYDIEVVPFCGEVQIIQGEGDDQKTIQLHPSQARAVARWIIESAAVEQGLAVPAREALVAPSAR